jgi:hypothetical protein
VGGHGAHAQEEARAAGGGDHDGAGGRWDIQVQGGKKIKLQKIMQPVYKKRSGRPEFMEEEFTLFTGDL